MKHFNLKFFYFKKQQNGGKYCIEIFLIQVEFPEARIYEETLNCLLYENRTGPDQELMQATSQTRPSYPSDDEDACGGPAGASGGSKGGVSGSGVAGGAVHNSSSSNHTQHERSGLARLRSSKHS